MRIERCGAFELICILMRPYAQFRNLLHPPTPSTEYKPFYWKIPYKSQSSKKFSASNKLFSACMFAYKHMSNACFVSRMGGSEKTMKRVDLILLVFENVFLKVFLCVHWAWVLYNPSQLCPDTQSTNRISLID